MNHDYFKVNYDILKNETVLVSGEPVKVSIKARLLYCHLSAHYEGFPLAWSHTQIAEHLGYGVQVVQRELASLETIGAISRAGAAGGVHAITVLDYPLTAEQPTQKATPEPVKEAEPVAEPITVTVTVKPDEQEPEIIPIEKDPDHILSTDGMTLFDVCDYIADNVFYKWPNETALEFTARMLSDLGKDIKDAPRLLRYIKETKQEVFEEMNELF